jgi:hypothetical protein
MAARSIFSLKAAHRFVSSQELRGWSYSVGRRSVLACASVTRADRGSQPCERRGIYGSAIAPAPCSAGVDAQLFAGVCKRCVSGLPFESSGSFGRDSFTHAPSFLCEAALAMSWGHVRGLYALRVPGAAGVGHGVRLCAAGAPERAILASSIRVRHVRPLILTVEGLAPAALP